MGYIFYAASMGAVTLALGGLCYGPGRRQHGSCIQKVVHSMQHQRCCFLLKSSSNPSSGFTGSVSSSPSAGIPFPGGARSSDHNGSGRLAVTLVWCGFGVAIAIHRRGGIEHYQCTAQPTALTVVVPAIIALTLAATVVACYRCHLHMWVLRALEGGGGGRT